MEQIIITRANGTTWPLLTKSAVSSITRAVQKRALLGEDIIDMEVVSAVALEFYRGDHITVFGSTYKLNSLPEPEKEGTRIFTYNLLWEGRQYDLLGALYLAVGEDGLSISPDFSLAGDLSTFIDVLINNLARVYGSGKWVKGDCPATDIKTLTFSNENCLAVLQNLCSEDNFGKEFEITESLGICTLNIKAAIGQNLLTTYNYGRGQGLYKLSRKNVSDKNIVTRLYVFGSDKNLPSDYRGYAQRLKLPGNDKSYIEDQDQIDLYGMIEGVKIFDEIFPHRTGTVTSLGASVYEFIDSSMNFDLTAKDSQGNTLYLVPGTSAKIHFNTGDLAGYEFEVIAYDHATKKFTIKAFMDERNQAFPDPATEAFQIAAQDEYVIVDIIMPQSYIDTAETELQTAGDTYYGQNDQPRVQYSLTFDELFLISLNPGPTIVNLFGIGDYLNVQDSDIGVDKAIRIKSLTKDLARYYKYELNLSDIKEPGTIQRILASNIETEKILAINRLRDVARAQRNWKSISELQSMVFDPDGYFDGTRIKPETIETIMATIGVKSQALSLDCIIEPNYQGDLNDVSITGGMLAHFGIGDDPVSWAVASGFTTLTDPGAYYIYAKCEKAGPAGSIFLSQAQIKYDEDANYWHFLIGVLLSIVDGVRWIKLTYGVTVINGRYITTGRIESQDGNVYFDLDIGEIGGKIKFQSGKYDNDVEDDIVTAQVAADAAGSVATSAMNNANAALSEITNISSDGILSKNEKPQVKLDYDTILAEQIINDAKAISYGITTERTAYDNAIAALTAYLTALNPAYTDFTQNTVIVGATFRTKFQDVYTLRQALLNEVYDSAVAIAIMAADDAAATAHRVRTETVINQGLITTGRVEVGSGNFGQANAWINGSVNPGDPDNDYRFGAGASYANKANALFYVKNNGNAGMKGVVEFGTLAVSVGSILQSIGLSGPDIWENTYDGDGSAILINRKGYNGGTTRYRDFVIYDGKGHKVFSLVGGATPSIYIGNAVDPINVAVELLGTFKLNGDFIRAANNHQIVIATNDITCSASETDMNAMSITLSPKGSQILILFDGSFHVSSANQTLWLMINVAGNNVRTMKSYITAGQMPHALTHLMSVTPGASITVKMRWSGSTAIQQYGAQDGQRSLKVIDLM